MGIINQIYLETSLGVSDYYTALRKAVRNLADQGITGANYVSATGRKTRNHIDVAVRRCILTSTTQTAGKMQIQRAKEWGSNLVEVSSHAGARPAHALWQGKIYSLEGSTPEYPNLAEVTGYGTVTGLCGANCGHHFYPYFEGISEQTYKPYDIEENNKVYEQSQYQRKLERDVRTQKRRILTAEQIGDTESKTIAQLKLKSKEAELKQFVKAAGRRQRTNRQQIIDFGRSETSKAVWAQRKAPLPKTAKTDDTVLQATLGDSKIKGVLPQQSDIIYVHVIAGAGTSTTLRAAKTLSEEFGGNPLQWQKKVGTIRTTNFDYEVHWEEYSCKQYRTKLVKVKKK